MRASPHGLAGARAQRLCAALSGLGWRYGFEKKNNETILVFDLGGGTFDVSVLEARPPPPGATCACGCAGQ